MQTGSSSPKARSSVAQAIDELDLGELGRALWRKKHWIVGLTLLTAGVAFLAVNMMTPRYKSEARLLIETRDNIFLRPEAERTGERSATVDQEAVTSQVQLILSRDLARDIIRNLKLGERPEFDPVLRGSSLVRTLLGIVGVGRDPMNQTPEERVLKSYFERLSAFQVEKSRVIAIEFESQDPELAARVANAIAEGYLVLQQAAKQEQTRAASQWLSGEIESLRKKVADAEAKVEEYRSKTNLFIGTNNTTLSGQQLGDYNAQLIAARGQKADAESKSRIIREALKKGVSVDFSDIINSELMRRLSEQHVTLRAQLAEQSSTLLGQHPRIKELRAQVADLEHQMRGEADRLARAFENDAKIAGGRVEALTSGLDQIKRQAASTNEQDVQLRALERDAKSQRDLLESYLAKFREASARDSIGAASPDARVVSRALVSNTPSWPKKLPTILVATLSMLMLSSGFVLSSELLGGGSVGVVRAKKRPAAAAIAEGQNADAAATPILDVARASAGVPLEAIEDLARSLAALGEPARRISVVGTRRNMGTTLTAITLARTLARHGRVVLVDLALGSPNLSAITSDASAPGISDLALGSATFGQVITRDRFSRVHIVSAGHATMDGEAVMSAQRLSIALEALARSYDHVVLDAGALSEISPERFARFASRAVLVADDAEGPVTEAARERLLKAGFPDVSVVAGGANAEGRRAAA
jgi:succinoglycan biosynthesis transport protein ExoP